jgi:Na+(H+)/acetate symporter ActP
VTTPTLGVLAVALVCVATIAIGAVGLRVSRTTSDFYVASRAVTPRGNASAIGGEYLSAASFLGVAGLVFTGGVDMLWFAVGYTAGYLVLLCLVAAPLRRSGAYTLPDFAQSRLSSTSVRRASALLVVGIGWLYLLPQMQGAGVALRSVTGSPVAAGAALVAAVVVLNVVAGGMRSITLVQAFQYWLKVTAIATPVLFLVVAWHSDGAPDPSAPGPPVARETTVTTLTDPVDVVAGTAATIEVAGTVDGEALQGPLELAEGERVRLGAGTEVTIEAGTPVPHAETVEVSDGPTWAAPLSGAGGREHPLYATYSLVLALLFGTMGLPHVLVRFYTNPDGRAARRTTAIVIGLLGLFYLWPPVYGALGRVYAADLLLTGRTDTVVLELPGRLLPAPWGDLTSALLVAGAFAAFLSTSSGLVVSVAGVISRDLLGGMAARRDWQAVALFRIGSVVAVVVPLGLSLVATSTSLAGTVGLAFAVAASTFCPLLLLGIWWRGLTAPGALWGLGVGGATSSAAVLLTIVGAPVPDLVAVLLQQPAAWTMPLAFGVMVLVSRLTRDRVPADVGRVMVRLHAPEAVRVGQRDREATARTDPPPARR